MPLPPPRSYNDGCAIALSLDLIGDRWALLIVRELLLGPRRYADLRLGLHRAAGSVVGQRLRDLVESGLVLHRDLGPPTRVHLYELTQPGRELEPILLALGRWGSFLPAPDDLPISIDSLVMSLKWAHPSPSPELEGDFEVRVGADTYSLEVHNGCLDLSRGPSRYPGAVLLVDATTLRAVLGGRRTLEEAQRTSDLLIIGSARASGRLLALIDAARRPRDIPYLPDASAIP